MLLTNEQVAFLLQTGLQQSQGKGNFPFKSTIISIIRKIQQIVPSVFNYDMYAGREQIHGSRIKQRGQLKKTRFESDCCPRTGDPLAQLRRSLKEFNFLSFVKQ